MSYRRIPSLNWLRVFEAAARLGSFSAAAKALNMSPAAVSQQIKALEGHLSAHLFERGPRNVTLTETGLAFAPVVKTALMSVETTAASLFGHELGRSVTVQATLIFATSWLTSRLPGFDAIHPGIQLHLMGDYHDEDLDRTGPDLNIVFGTTSRTWGESKRLFGETIYPVATPDLIAKLQTPKDLLSHRLIEISTHRTNWLQLLESLNLPDRYDARFCFADTSEMALAMAASGYGIALARAPVTDQRLDLYGLKRCFNDISLQGDEAYHLVCPSFRYLSPAAKLFANWLCEEAREPLASA